MLEQAIGQSASIDVRSIEANDGSEICRVDVPLMGC
jgi:hypothetical protein